MRRIGIVVPTIFSRPQYLPVAVKTIRASGDCFLLLSSQVPSNAEQALLGQLSESGQIDTHLIATPGLPLAEKINEALRALPADCEYIGWLGDDDILLPGALLAAAEVLDGNPDAVMAYGGCDYISATGDILFTNHSSQFAATLLKFGPQLIPQPGALWRRETFEKVGGLSGKYNLAFDFDLFLKLSQEGQLRHIPQTLAQFRWHPDSLSVKRRWLSTSEASKVRRKHYSGLMLYIWPLWEPWVVTATWLAGKIASIRARFMTHPGISNE
jgi:GT2 family glycosyltransferase